GLGQALSSLSEQYQINDAYALAFFHHESTYGKYGVAASTRNFGNIRCTAGSTCDPKGLYRSYASWQAGAADWFKLISTVYVSEGRTTVASIIPKYAPSDDGNNVTAYINAVSDDVSRWQKGQV